MKDAWKKILMAVGTLAVLAPSVAPMLGLDVALSSQAVQQLMDLLRDFGALVATGSALYHSKPGSQKT